MTKQLMRKIIVAEAINHITNRFPRGIPPQPPLKSPSLGGGTLQFTAEDASQWSIRRSCFYDEPYFEDFSVHYHSILAGKEVSSNFFINRELNKPLTLSRPNTPIPIHWRKANMPLSWGIWSNGSQGASPLSER
jgi:hypothetical protein